MEGKDSIKDLFSQKLGNYEVPVSPDLWTSISAQLPTVASSAGVGLSTFSKILIGSSIAASLTIGSYFIFKDSSKIIKEGNQEKKTENKSEKRIEVNTNDKLVEQSSVNISNVEKNIFSDSSSIVSFTENNNAENQQGIKLENNILSSISENNNVIPSNINEQQNVTPLIQDNKKNSTNSIENQQIETNEITHEIEITPDEVKIAQFTSDLKLDLPNIFTPNGDGKNDFLEFDTKGIEDFSIVVLNEKGQTIFQSPDNQFKWDGRMPNGDLVDSGSYVYYITGKDYNGKLITKYSRLIIKY